MSTAQFDVTAIGNAIVDVIAQADDAFLDKHKLPKGAMNLIDTETAERLYGDMGPGKEASGGSAGNTIAGIAALGGRTAYIGKVAKDQLGDVFTHDMRAVGVKYDTAPLVGGLPTARSLIIVTPDAQRTMQTFLGATTQLGPEDVDMGAITSSKVLYLEGYLWDQPRAKEAMRNAAIGRPEGRRQGGVHAVRLVLRGALPRRVPRAGGQARGHPVRQRARDPVALRGRGVRRCAAEGARALRNRGADAQREGLGGAARRRGARDRRRPRRQGGGTRPAPAMRTRRGSCMPTRRGWTWRPAGGSAGRWRRR
jgi:hypothetical protein